MAAQTLKISISLADSDVQTFLEKNQQTERKTESYVNGFGNDISRGWERKSTIDLF